MKRTQILNLLDELFELSPGSLNGTEQLADIESWSSLTALGFFALADEHFGTVVLPNSLERASTVNDLISLLKISGERLLADAA